MHYFLNAFFGLDIVELSLAFRTRQAIQFNDQVTQVQAITYFSAGKPVHAMQLCRSSLSRRRQLLQPRLYSLHCF